MYLGLSGERRRHQSDEAMHLMDALNGRVANDALRSNWSAASEVTAVALPCYCFDLSYSSAYSLLLFSGPLRHATK